MKLSRFASFGFSFAFASTTIAVVNCSGPDHPGILNPVVPGSDASPDQSAPPVDAGHDSGSSDAAKDGMAASDAPGDVVQPVDAPADVAFDAAECSDGVKDGNETDVDCGGGMCPPCPSSDHCEVPTDCQSKVCSDFICQAPSCTDGVQNGTETDVDCGGPSCSPCADLKHCSANSDCVDKICTMGVCSLPTCTDGVKNGHETDVDCGGGTCPKCIIGKTCGTGTDCQSNVCNGTCQCPGGMVIVPVNVANGGDYCIDTLEVTKAAYNQFLQQNPPLDTQIPACSWNTTYTPGGNWPPTLTETGYNGGEPVQFVNWCDAYAYCTTVGKHLCGLIGTGGAVAQGSYADATQDQWFNACSAQGQNVYPYSGTYHSCDSPTAVVYEIDYSSNINPMISPCQGGESGLYAMSGNVAEWENSCDSTGSQNDAGQVDNCLVRGGSFGGTATTERCDAMLTQPRDFRDASVGFRCCL